MRLNKITIILVFCICITSCDKINKLIENQDEGNLIETYNLDYNKSESKLNGNEQNKYDNNKDQSQNEYNSRVPSYNGASTKGKDRYVGSDGRIYENKACGWCNGSGVIESYDMVSGGLVRNICNACEGVGQLSY